MNYAVRITDYCNLDCDYCYAKTDNPNEMSLGTLIMTMGRICQTDNTDITINWTGGEPILRGIEFFREIIMLQKMRSHITFHNVVQTNLTLLDDEFIQFFAENNFQVRTSLDLPQQNHDTLRIDNNFNETMEKIQKLQKASVEINVNTVVTNQNIDQADEIYSFLKEHKITSFSVSRFVLQGNALDNDQLMIQNSGDFGRFLIELFDFWMADADGCLERITPLDNLTNATKAWLAQEDPDKPCFHCQDQVFAIDPIGKVFPSCNKFLAHKDTCFGDVFNNRFDAIMDSPKRQAFLEKVTASTGKVCPTCKYKPICKGGCFFLAYASKLDGNLDREDFCKGYYFVFEHIIKYLEGQE